MCISNILDEHRSEIERYRQLLFPLIDFELITGFNIYEEPERFPDSQIVVSHLHSELEEGRIYRNALEDRIKKCCATYSIQRIRYEKIDRHTAYRLREGWEADEYYDSEGNVLTGERVKEILTSGGTIIGGGIQNDMKIALERVEDLHALIEEFRIYFNLFRIDPVSGKPVLREDGAPETNTGAVIGSWEVPVFTVNSVLDLKLGNAYPCILDVRITKPDYSIDIMVDEKEEPFRKFLSGVFLNVVFRRVHANRIFVDYINETINPEKHARFVQAL